MDVISSLHDDILIHILGFLSLKESGSTCVIAKRWKNLFALSPALCLNLKEEITNSFVDFVDRLLDVSGTLITKKFYLRCYKTGLDPVVINGWLINVLMRGVSQLHLDIFGMNNYVYPSELFSCLTVVELKLKSYGGVVTVPHDVSLPTLKSLFLTRVQFLYHDGSCGFKALVSACPVLEELVMAGVNSKDDVDDRLYCKVSSPTLKRLTMRGSHLFPEHQSLIITLDTPSLAYLEYLGFLPEASSVVKFDSLAKAKLHLFPLVSDSNPSTNLLQSLRNVEMLEFSARDSLEILYTLREAIRFPVLNKLHHLSIATKCKSSNKSWQVLPLLVKNAPKLETLVIKSRMRCDENEQLEFTKDIQSLPGLSMCKIKIKFEFN